MMDMCCGDEVKGEGYILNLILYSFLGFLENPESQENEKTDFFPCRAYILKRVFKPSPFTFLFKVLCVK